MDCPFAFLRDSATLRELFWFHTTLPSREGDVGSLLTSRLLDPSTCRGVYYHVTCNPNCIFRTGDCTSVISPAVGVSTLVLLRFARLVSLNTL